MNPHYLYPKLRWPIELRIEKAGSQEALLVRCPIGVSDAPLLLVPQLAPVVACFSGSLSIDQIVTRFAPQGLQREVLIQLVELLDANYFLMTPRFVEAVERQRTTFTTLAERPAALSGLAYAANPAQLKAEIELHLAQVPARIELTSRQLVCLVSPHIDYHRGASGYANAYSRLHKAEHDLLILIGTAHQYSDLLFHLTKKHFVSPLGRLPCDIEFVSNLASLYGNERSFADEILHKQEHSLELQLPFMSCRGVQASIVPIIVGGFYRMLESGREPHEVPEYDDFAGALTACIRQARNGGGRVGFIAGVDMAHVGRSFGDQFELTDAVLDGVRVRDLRYLDLLCRGDLSGLFAHVAEDKDARRICGFPTMYTIIDVLKRCGVGYQAEIFDYQQAVNRESQCAVTFASLGFYSAP